jgi:hypothetical protein
MSGHSPAGSEPSSRRCLRHGLRLRSSPVGVGLVCRSCRRYPGYGLDVVRDKRGRKWKQNREKKKTWTNQTHHINQDIQRTPTPLLNQFSSIVLLPLILLIIAEVTLERLLAPGAVRRVRDRCERRDGLVLARVAEELTN